eukprot:9634186-Karenia_brevis.AAC.1
MGASSTEQLRTKRCDSRGSGTGDIRTPHGQELQPDLAGRPSILSMGDDDRRRGGQLQHGYDEILQVLCDDGEGSGIRGSPSSQVGRSYA